MAAYSLDLRERIVAAYDRGGVTQKQVGESFGVSQTFVAKLLKQRRETGELGDRYHRGRKPGTKITPEYEEKIRGLVDGQPDITLEEIRDELGLGCTPQAVYYALRRMGYSYKKRRYGHASSPACEQSREDVAEARENWRRDQPKLDPAALVFLDESGAKTNMTRLYGRAVRSSRCHATAPSGRWETTTMISSVRLDGTTACMALEGATNTEVFRAYIGEVLLPTLRPGDLVIMDNLSAHKNAETLELIRSAGAEPVFLPPYSPDFNPIEMMWSKVKSILRKLEARDTETLFDAIGEALSEVTQKDALGWFTRCGYSMI